MPTPDPATNFDDAASGQREGESQDFDALLRELARPPQVGEQITQELADRVDVPFAGAALQAASAARSPIDEPQPGELLGGCYLIRKTLGRGGMGVVLEAQNQRTGKRVAIKWMNASTKGDMNASAIARFRREARVVAEIDHLNVVNVYDVGEREGTPFLVMELLRGETLRAKLARGPLSWDEARQLMLGITRGVQAVHRAGVVHRDLKPDNIFLARSEDGPPVTKVLDFGVAAMRKGLDAGSASLTQTGAILGTPAYMALEQLKGEDVDARADVYALGAMLYEMVTGALPFNARTIADFAVLQATELPVRPSRHLRSLRGGREQLLLRALARRSEDRYQDAGALALALESDGQNERVGRLRPLVVPGLLALIGLAAALHHERLGQEKVGRSTADPARVQQPALETQRRPVELAPPHDSPRSVALPAQALAADAGPAARPEPLVRPARPRRTRLEASAKREEQPAQGGDRGTIDTFTEIRLEDF